MMVISRTQLFVFLAIALLIVVFAIGITWKFSRKVQTLPSSVAVEGNATFETPKSKTVLPVPQGVVVPEKDSGVQANIAKPETVVPQAAGVDEKYRTFDIQVNGDKFIPDTVIINKGDIAHINFLAIDKNYDFKQPDTGFAGPLPKGQKKVLEGQFNASGKFILYCESCGGPDKGPIANIIVVSKD